MSLPVLVAAVESEVFVGLLEVFEFLLGQHFVPRLVDLGKFEELVGKLFSGQFVEDIAVSAVKMVLHKLVEKVVHCAAPVVE